MSLTYTSPSSVSPANGKKTQTTLANINSYAPQTASIATTSTTTASATTTSTTTASATTTSTTPVCSQSETSCSQTGLQTCCNYYYNCSDGSNYGTTFCHQK